LFLSCDVADLAAPGSINGVREQVRRVLHELLNVFDRVEPVYVDLDPESTLGGAGAGGGISNH